MTVYLKVCLPYYNSVKLVIVITGLGPSKSKDRHKQINANTYGQFQISRVIVTEVKFPIVSEVPVPSDKIGRSNIGNGIRALPNLGKLVCAPISSPMPMFYTILSPMLSSL